MSPWCEGVRQKEFESASEAKKEATRLERKASKDRDNAVEHEESMLNRRIYLEAAAASCLQVPLLVVHPPRIPLYYPSTTPLLPL